MDEAELFVVHVWHDHERFRAAARRVDLEQTHVFTSADQLAQFFAAAARPAGGSAETPTTDGGSR